MIWVLCTFCCALSAPSAQGARTAMRQPCCTHLQNEDGDTIPYIARNCVRLDAQHARNLLCSAICHRVPRA